MKKMLFRIDTTKEEAGTRYDAKFEGEPITMGLVLSRVMEENPSVKATVLVAMLYVLPAKSGDTISDFLTDELIKTGEALSKEQTT